MYLQNRNRPTDVENKFMVTEGEAGLRDKLSLGAPHSSTLAWKIPWTEEPGGLQSMGSLKSQTRLGDFTLTFHFHALEKATATHSSAPAWGIPRLKRLSSSSIHPPP